MIEKHKIRIESVGDVSYKTFIDNIQISRVIRTTIDLNSKPKRAIVEFQVDVEPIEFYGEVKKIMYTYVDGVKYKLQKV